MDKNYSPSELEQSWYQKWETEHFFAPSQANQAYAIMLPPPNITGSLHMGHGFQHTLMDALTRYHRMCGKSTLWQPGTDHAGISTQMVVERQLEAQGHTRKEFNRNEFIDKIWQWKQESGGKITQQMRRLGDSVDWSRERFTLDDGLSEAVKKVFIQLYEEGLIYRGKRLVNWDPKLGTAVSDLEVISEEEQGFLWHIAYPVVDSEEHLIVATTRPETLLGDTAVAVNPDDERYRHLVGKCVTLPLCNRNIPVIADEYVDKEFGSGCVKITPGHDFNDYQVGMRHDLPIINIFTKTATLNETVPKQYRGLDRFEARKAVLDDLSQINRLVRTQEHTLTVPRGEKSSAVIEPFLTDQWYVNIKPLAKPAIEAVKKGEIKFIPESWDKTYFQWMENIEDWCISRQLWWGHRIPAWYDKNGKVYVGQSENDVRFKNKLSEEVVLNQDEDVLDTWFSSALWPFSTLGWPEKTIEFEKFYPTDALVTGFDIIFFWVARMIMMGLKFTGEIPFKQIYVTGLIRDAEGHKMSKSKGNVLDPLDIIDGIGLEALIEKRTANLMLGSSKDKIIAATKKEFPEGIKSYGTDALRFTFCSLASTGRNIRFDMGRVEGYRNFCNKLWNAARYVLQNTEAEFSDWGDGAFQYSPADQWILSRLQRTINLAHEHFTSYRFDLLANCLYDFVWHEYCDWYLELSKPILYNENVLAPLKRGTRRTLIYVLEQILCLLHPIMPFITEDIWQRVAKLTSKQAESIMLTDYPQVVTEIVNSEIEQEIEWLKTIIQSVRNIRGEMNIAPGKLIPLFLHKGSDTDKQWHEKYHDLILSLAKLSNIQWIGPHEALPTSATALVGQLELLIPMADLIDKTAELERLNKELNRLSKDIDKAQAKLNNENFIKRAPQEIIDKEQLRLDEAHHARKSIEEKIASIQQL